MKLLNLKYILLSLAAGVIFQNTLLAQVGIGTVEPEGILDVESTTQGIVFPRVVLTSIIVEAPVVNPNGSNLVAGTAVYNTTPSNNGTNDVYPGVYIWSGSIWSPQFNLEQYQKFEQTGGCLRTEIEEATSDPDPSNVISVPMDGASSNTFTPTYTGTYRIELKANFAAGEIDPFTSNDDISLATSEGAFFFALSGTGVDIDPVPGSSQYDYNEGWLYTHSYSSHSAIETPNLNHDKIPHYATTVFYKYLSAGQPYTFTLTNNINTGEDYFVDGGDESSPGVTSVGQGHIGHNVPCTIDFTFLKE
jgi:hypothetical protein